MGFWYVLISKWHLSSYLSNYRHETIIKISIIILTLLLQILRWLNPLGTESAKIISQCLWYYQGKIGENNHHTDSVFLSFLKDGCVQKLVITIFSFFFSYILAIPLLLAQVKTRWREDILYGYFLIGWLVITNYCLWNNNVYSEYLFSK